MGYVPAIFVILGGFFLWGIVVHNSLKSQIAILKARLEKLKEASLERNRILQALFNELAPLELSEINQDYLVKAQSIPYDLNRFFMPDEIKTYLWTEKIIESLKSKGYNQEQFRLLSEVSSTVRNEIKEFSKVAHSYNKLVNTKPTSFMASTLQFQEIPL